MLVVDAIFPRATYAEDQQHAHAVLTTHVMHRAINLGAVVGLGMYSIRAARTRILQRSPTPQHPQPLLKHGALHAPGLLRTVAGSTMWTCGFLAIGLAGRMWGRELIEWQDRSWRLLGHSTQRNVDRWSAAGGAVGSIASLAFKRSSPSLFARGFGGFALGSIAGVLALEVYKSTKGTQIGSVEVK